MNTTRGLAALIAASLLVAGCGGGGSSAPDVTGAPTSGSATLFKASNLGKVLAKAKTELAGSPASVLKIEPRDVKIVGQTKTVTVDNAGKALAISTPSIPGQTFSLDAVSPATVESVVKAVESKANLKQSDIAYVAVAVDPIGGKPFMGVYPVSGNGHYEATINGGNLKSIGGSSGGAQSGGSTSGGGSSKAASSSAGSVNPQAIANCIAKAGTDATKIAACAGK